MCSNRQGDLGYMAKGLEAKKPICNNCIYSKRSNTRLRNRAINANDIFMIKTTKTMNNQDNTKNTATRNGLKSMKIRGTMFLAMEWE
jgi:hypothetical protein